MEKIWKESKIRHRIECNWKYEITDNSYKKLLDVDFRKYIKAFCLRLLSILSGNFSFLCMPYKEHEYVGNICLGEIFRIFKIPESNYTVIWSIAVKPGDYGAKQIIKIWDIVETDSLYLYFEKYCGIFKQFHDEYLKLCVESEKKDENLYVPKQINEGVKYIFRHDDENFYIVNNNVSETSSLSDSAVMMKSYKIPPSFWEYLLNQEGDALRQSQIQLPFELSVEEKRIVKYQDSCIVVGRSGTGKTSVIVRKMINGMKTMFERKELKISQMMLSRNSILIKKTAECFKHIIRTLSRCNEIRCSTTEIEYVNKKKKKSSTLACFSTFIGFLNTLNSSVNKPFFVSEDKENDLTDKRVYMLLGKNRIDNLYRRENQVTFRIFKSIYYIHFKDQAKKLFDAETLFAEFLSVIKGSIESMLMETGKISQEQYLSLYDTKAGRNLNIYERTIIYECFERYEKLKNKKVEDSLDSQFWDMADICQFFYKQLITNEYIIQEHDLLDYLYIDETQDLLPCQMILLKYFLKEQSKIMFCGDTAQCIQAGNKFRVKSLKSIYSYYFPSYNFRRESKKCEKVKIDQFFLQRNYRSHSNIVKAGNTIISLIKRFFPDEIDNVPSDLSSSVNGEKSLFYKDIETNVFCQDIFDHSKGISSGSDQVILVRNQIIKEKLKILIPDATVFTIAESKGLEWDDVYIYNFFADSMLYPENRWRVLLDREERKQNFDPIKHRTLCAELKNLYVCITRAKVQLIFFDENKAAREAFMTLMKEKELFEVRFYKDQIKGKRYENFTDVNWADKGKEYKMMGYYEEAKRCFEKVNSVEQAQLMQAYLYEENAKKCKVYGDLYGMKKNLKLSATIYKKYGKKEKAGAMYELGGFLYEATEIYKNLHDYHKTFLLFMEGRKFQEALELFESFENQIRMRLNDMYVPLVLKLAENFRKMDTVMEHSRKKLKYTGNCIKSIKLLQNDEEIRNYLIKYNFYENLAQFEEGIKNIVSTAHIHENVLGNYDEASRLYYRQYITSIDINEKKRFIYQYIEVQLRYIYMYWCGSAGLINEKIQNDICINKSMKDIEKCKYMLNSLEENLYLVTVLGDSEKRFLLYELYLLKNAFNIIQEGKCNRKAREIYISLDLTACEGERYHIKLLIWMMYWKLTSNRFSVNEISEKNMKEGKKILTDITEYFSFSQKILNVFNELNISRTDICKMRERKSVYHFFSLSTKVYEGNLSDEMIKINGLWISLFKEAEMNYNDRSSIIKKKSECAKELLLALTKYILPPEHDNTGGFFVAADKLVKKMLVSTKTLYEQLVIRRKNSTNIKSYFQIAKEYYHITIKTVDYFIKLKNEYYKLHSIILYLSGNTNMLLCKYLRNIFYETKVVFSSSFISHHWNKKIFYLKFLQGNMIENYPYELKETLQILFLRNFTCRLYLPSCNINEFLKKKLASCLWQIQHSTDIEMVATSFSFLSIEIFRLYDDDIETQLLPPILVIHIFEISALFIFIFYTKIDRLYLTPYLVVQLQDYLKKSQVVKQNEKNNIDMSDKSQYIINQFFHMLCSLMSNGYELDKWFNKFNLSDMEKKNACDRLFLIIIMAVLNTNSENSRYFLKFLINLNYRSPLFFKMRFSKFSTLKYPILLFSFLKEILNDSKEENGRLLVVTLDHKLPSSEEYFDYIVVQTKDNRFFIPDNYLNKIKRSDKEFSDLFEYPKDIDDFNENDIICDSKIKYIEIFYSIIQLIVFFSKYKKEKIKKLSAETGYKANNKVKDDKNINYSHIGDMIKISNKQNNYRNKNKYNNENKNKNRNKKSSKSSNKNKTNNNTNNNKSKKTNKNKKIKR